MTRPSKTTEELIAEGKPCIRYTKDGKQWHEQAFYTEKSCKMRTKELVALGFAVERVQ
jgi:hypothetical protein